MEPYRTEWEVYDEDIKLARRISGGGTVYHDEGNLNYSIIEDNKTYNSNKIYKMILDALKNLNIEWDFNSIVKYINNPENYAPGTYKKKGVNNINKSIKYVEKLMQLPEIKK